jgi:hypothetical protein
LRPGREEEAFAQATDVELDVCEVLKQHPQDAMRTTIALETVKETKILPEDNPSTPGRGGRRG